MGESFYDAVDDIGPERTPKAPEVIETLADQWQKGGYDIRWLLRTITGNRSLPAASARNHDRRGQDRIRFELSQPASFRPDRRGPERGAGVAGRPGRRPDRRLEPWSRRQTVTSRSGERQEQPCRRMARRPSKPPASARPPRRPKARLRACAWAARGPHSTPSWHRPLDPQRRRHGHDTPGPFPDERPDGPQPDPGPARDRAGRDPGDRTG